MIEQDATHSTQETVLQCDCTDRNGKPKKLYNSYKEVQSIKKLREKEVGKKLTIYPCPNFPGKYHLTKEQKNKRKKAEGVCDLLDKLQATT